MKLPCYPDGILFEHRVSCDDRPVFLHALRNQHAIERVTMMHREMLESEHVVNADVEALDAVVRQSAEHVWTSRPREIQLARLYLIRISQMLAVLNERSVEPAKMSRA